MCATWGIGLRVRFFFVALLVLVLTAVSITGLLAFYYRSERLSFFDDQIRQTATAIVDSKLLELKTYDYEMADALISEELGPDRVGKFFVIRNSKGEILFQTDNIDMLETQVPQSPRWITINEDNRLLRVANLDLPKFGDRKLQVGVIADSSFIFWSTLNFRAILFIAVILLVILLMTWLLSASLFSPVRSVAAYAFDAKRALEKNQDIPDLPKDLKRYLGKKFLSKDDDFKTLLSGVASLAQQVNLNNKFTKSWTFQMVHEIKTPLTILNRDLELLEEKKALPAEERKSLTSNVNKVSATITDFLNWAEVAYSGAARNLHVLKISQVIEELALDWEKLAAGRLQISAGQDFLVMCDPAHLQQLLNNLVVNSLRYTSSVVNVSYQGAQVSISDLGSGLPQDVLERLGTPFNKGPKKVSGGSGLGLAWVKAIADRYGWGLDISSSEQGSNFTVTFPELHPDE